MAMSDSVFALGTSPNLDVSSTHLSFLTFTVWETTTILFLHNGIFIKQMGRTYFKPLWNSPRLSHKEVIASFTLVGVLPSKSDFLQTS